MKRSIVRWLGVTVLVCEACGGASVEASSAAAARPSASPPVASAPSVAPSAGVTATATPASQNITAPPIDVARVEALTGAKPVINGDVVKVSFPRDDVKVAVDGWQKMPPFMGLTSWAAFEPGRKQGVTAMVMGDLVLFEDEVNPAMSAALDAGLEVTALHNHFFYDKPRVYFMHIGGEGTVEQLAKGVRSTLDAERAVRAKSAQPASAFGTPPPTPSKIDGAKLDVIFGVKGQSKDGMYKATMGRKTQAECGCSVGKAMGVATWAAFGGKDEDAIVDGDFAVTDNELQPVLKTLRAGGIDVVAIHSHMTNETPRILFLHYWGRGRAAMLALVVKRALDLTAWDGKTQST